jgi:hypothetical protein
MTLRAVRSKGEAFDGRFFEKSPLHWPIAAAAAVFADAGDWPAPEEYDRAFRGRAGPVRFARSEPVKRRRRERPPVDPESMYDANIVRGVVPTRARCWHDFLNALVWATFPAAKRALHARQYAMIRAWATPGARTLPNARTREQDAVALVDEGGILLLTAPERTVAVPFGHALFEGLVYRTPSMIARGVPLAVDALPTEREALLELADRALARLLESTTLAPEMLPRHPLADPVVDPAP